MIGYTTRVRMPTLCSTVYGVYFWCHIQNLIEDLTVAHVCII